MTLAIEAPDCGPRLQDSIQQMRRVLSGAGYGVPAAALHDRALAAWVRAHGVTVIAHDDDELDLVQYSGIRPSQVVFRCGQSTDCIRRAVNLGVFRFIVATEHQIVRLGQCAQRTKYLYLDDHAPLVLGDQRLKVIGLHGDVDDSGGATEWATTAERLLCRTALLKTCGSPIHRIMLSGGSTDIWLDDQAQQLTSIASAVDEALDDACDRWSLTRPAVTLAPSTAPVQSQWLRRNVR
jgi:diaminopimelate decarboxylase